jgi:hypothetical protein
MAPPLSRDWCAISVRDAGCTGHGDRLIFVRAGREAFLGSRPCCIAKRLAAVRFVAPIFE